jgi:glycosyltransferase involved in cell wall biosynthesis
MRSGGAPFAFRLCEKLGERGVEVLVLTSKIPNLNTSPLFRILPLMRDWSWSELPRLIRLARRYRPDVIDLHFAGSIYRNQPMISLAPTILRWMLPKVRFVTHFEYPEPINVDRLSKRTRAIRKAFALWIGSQKVDYQFGTILCDSDRIVVLSQDYVSMLAKRVESAAAKCVLIPPPPTVPICPELNPSARQYERRLLQCTPQDFLLAYYGLLYPGKGLEVLLEAFHLLIRRNKPVRLLIVGGENEVMLSTWRRQSYSRDLIEMAAQLSVADRIFWTGDCPFDGDRASRYLRLADACVLPFDDGVKLHNSSFSVAAAHGLAIVTTRSATTESAFVDGRNVVTAPPKNPVALAECIASVVDSPLIRRRLQDGALELTRQWFSWDKALDQTMEVFRGEPEPSDRLALARSR